MRLQREVTQDRAGGAVGGLLSPGHQTGFRGDAPLGPGLGGGHRSKGGAVMQGPRGRNCPPDDLESTRATGGWGQAEVSVAPAHGARCVPGGVVVRLCGESSELRHRSAPRRLRDRPPGRGASSPRPHTRGQPLLRGSSKDKAEKESPKSSRATQKSSNSGCGRGRAPPAAAGGGGPRHCVLAFSSSL